MSEDIGKHVGWIFEHIPWPATIVSFLATFSLVRYLHGFPIESAMSAFVVCASITVGCFYVYQNPTSPSIPVEPVEKFIPAAIGMTLITVVYFYVGFAVSTAILMVISDVVDNRIFYKLSYLLLGGLMLSPIIYMASQRAKHYKI